MITFIEKILGEKMKKKHQRTCGQNKTLAYKSKKEKLYVVLYILRMVGYV